MNSKKQIKTNRLLVFVVHDPKGIIDKATLYYAEKLCAHVSKFVVVCNGFLVPESEEKIREFASELFFRENNGYDAWAYKYGLETVGWDELRKYDEVILANDTVFGPIFPLSEMFDTMSEYDLDFWGASMHHGNPDKDFTKKNPYSFIPRHIQSYFTVYSSRFLSDRSLEEYWKNLPLIRTYHDAVGKHETVFTKYFEDKGFRWNVYADLDEIDRIGESSIYYEADLMIKAKRFPFVKRKLFTMDLLFDRPTSGELARKTMDYLQKQTDFDTNMIWDWLLRTTHQYDIVKNLSLTYVSSDNVSDRIDSGLPKAAVYFSVQDATMRNMFCDYQANIPNIVETFHAGSDSHTMDLETLITQFDVFCLIRDPDFEYSGSVKARNGCHYKTMENMLGSKAYIENVLAIFDANPRLGMLVAPPPIHARYASFPNREWGTSYHEMEERYNVLGLHCPISEEKPPIAPLDGAGWFRSEAMRHVVDAKVKLEDIPTLLYSYILQDAGYYSAYLMSNSYASLEYTNLIHYLRALNTLTKKYNTGKRTFPQTLEIMDEKMKSESVISHIRRRWRKWRRA